MTQVVNGYRFPDGVNVPDNHWYRGKAGGDEFWILGWQGYVAVAHQCGLELVGHECMATGQDSDGIPYIAIQTEVLIDGDSYCAVGSADAPSNSLDDMASTAQSRALKRAIKIALDIRRVDDHAEPDEPAAVESAPDDVEFDDDHALSDTDDGW